MNTAPEIAADPLAAAADGLPEVVDQVAAVARLYGEPLFAMPHDLYIPPDALEVFLETFQGPLDLLLYLIRKQNFNILDIPLADVTRQYLEYVEQIRKRNLELAAEYLLMAAMLIEIKSRMLLPPKRSDDGGEPEDPRAELVRRLLEYEQMKLAAARLDPLPVLGRDFLRAQVTVEASLVPRFADVSADELREAWLDILKRAKLVQHHRITREQLSVREHMSIVLRAPAGPAFRRVRGAVRGEPRPAGDGRDLHRDARAGARAPARTDPGRGLCADLRAPRVPARLSMRPPACRGATALPPRGPRPAWTARRRPAPVCGIAPPACIESAPTPPLRRFDRTSMSSHNSPGDNSTPSARKPITLHRLREMHAAGEKIAMLTAYDASFARLADAAGVDCLLVGDSLGMVVQGHAQHHAGHARRRWRYHTRARARGNRSACLIADLPFGSYHEAPDAGDAQRRGADAAPARRWSSSRAAAGRPRPCASWSSAACRSAPTWA